LLSLLMGVSLIGVNVLYGNFNCRFSQIRKNINYDYLILLLVFIVFELEILLVLVLHSVIVLLVVIGITYYELIVSVVS